MKKKIAIVGCGKLGNVVAGALLDGYLPEYQLTGAYSRSFEKAEALSALFPDTCRLRHASSIIKYAFSHDCQYPLIIRIFIRAWE